MDLELERDICVVLHQLVSINLASCKINAD